MKRCRVIRRCGKVMTRFLLLVELTGAVSLGATRGRCDSYMKVCRSKQTPVALEEQVYHQVRGMKITDH